MADVEIPDDIMDRVRDFYRRAGYTSPTAFVVDAVDHRLVKFEIELNPQMDYRELFLRDARLIVPRTDEREHFNRDETFTANTDLETRFVAMVIETQGQRSASRTHRWTRVDFLLPPEERDTTMEQWTASMYRAGKVFRSDLERWGLPIEWIESVEQKERPGIPEPIEQAEEILSVLRRFNDEFEEVEPEHILPAIEPGMPVWQNFRTFLDEYWV